MWYKIWLKDPENMPQTTYQLAAIPNGTPFTRVGAVSKDRAIWIMWSDRTEPIASDWLNKMWDKEGEVRLEPYSDYPLQLTTKQQTEFDEHVAAVERWPFDE